MQASKSREDLPDFDLFRCLSCGTLIRDAKPPAKTGKKGDKTSDQAGQAGSAEKR
jgi:hypothetical protein